MRSGYARPRAPGRGRGRPVRASPAGAVRRDSRQGRRKIKGAVCAPYPGFIEPCRPALKDRPPEHGKWIQEIKHDGYRLQAHLIQGKAALYTRRGYDWSDRVSSVAAELKKLPASEVVLDGELVVQNQRGISDFHELQTDLAAGRTDRLSYLVFDVLYLDGIDLRETALITRRQLLEELIGKLPEVSRRIRMSEYFEADSHTVFNQACAMGLEGIIAKRSDSPYRSGQQELWIKVKCVKTDTFPIVAFVEKLGACPRRIASLYLGRRDGNKLLYAGKAQTGFRQQTLYELRERLDPYIRKTSPLSVAVRKPKATWVDPVLQAEIEYSSCTADKLLRAPVFKGIRDDLLERKPKRTQREEIEHSRLRVPKENVLQLLPDAVVPTKEQLAWYWSTVASKALKYLARRPLKLVRHSHGTTFYHKGPLPPLPYSVHQLRIIKREGGMGVRVWVEDFDGLLGLVAIGAVELHAWNSTVDDVEHPDVMVFDLDPGPGVSFEFIKESAFALRDLLKREGLKSWPKLTGGKGLHVMVPLGTRSMSHDEAHRYSQKLASRLAATQPARYTTAAAAARDGRVFVDFLRNGRGTTAVGAYSPRARRGFPIAAPTTWRALEQCIRPDEFTLTRRTAAGVRVPMRASGRKTQTRVMARGCTGGRP